ncbi:MAG TPA: WD40 repeat domain-containing protein, partial [Gemmataceae bacterium]|nr:WD40 repeat domain-containing protein [Gemmataceae bacterium]
MNERRLWILACCILLTAALLNASVAFADERPRTDLYGDPLPEGAIARLGTVRLRHAGRIFCLAFSRSGKVLASATGTPDPALQASYPLPTGSNLIQLWDPSSGNELRQLEGHQGLVRSLSFSSDGKLLASAGDDGQVRLWETSSGKALRQFSGGGQPSSIAFAQDGKLAWPATDDSIGLFSADTGQEVRRYRGPKGITHFAFSPDGKTLAAGYNYNQGICLWNVDTGRQLHHLRWPQSVVWSVAFSPDGKLLASGSYDRTIRFWDVATGKELRQVQGEVGSVQAVSFSPDGRTLASTGERTVLWDVATGKELRKVAGDFPPGYALAFSPDGKTLARSAGQAIRLIDLAAGKEVHTLQAHVQPVRSVTFSPDDKMIATAGDRLRLWDTATGRGRPLEETRAPTTCAAFSPDGKLLALGCSDQTIRLCNSSSGKQLRQFTGDPGDVEFISFLPDGKTAASMSRHKIFKGANNWTWKRELSVRLWDIASGKEVRQVGNVMMDRVALPPDCRLLATGMNWIQLWDMASGQQLGELRGQLAMVYALAFSPDGRRVVSSFYDQQVRRYELAQWEVASGQLVCHFEGQAGVALALAVSSSGKVLASAGSDGIVR